jgi:hypothetical protein
MWTKFLIGTALGLMLALAPGCSRIHEPWVPDPDQFKMERSRSSELHKALRLRLRETQRDR